MGAQVGLKVRGRKAFDLHLTTFFDRRSTKLEVMCSVALIALLSFVARAHADQVAANHIDDSADDFADKFVQMFANKLIDRIEASSTLNTDLDITTLGKPGNLEIPLQHNLPVQTSYGQDQEPDQFESMLERVLSVSGGAKKAKAKPAKAKSATPKKAKTGNAYFTKLAEARKSGAKSFEYNGKTYVQGKAKSGMIIYKSK